MDRLPRVMSRLRLRAEDLSRGGRRAYGRRLVVRPLDRYRWCWDLPRDPLRRSDPLRLLDFGVPLWYLCFIYRDPSLLYHDPLRPRGERLPRPLDLLEE